MTEDWLSSAGVEGIVASACCGKVRLKMMKRGSQAMEQKCEYMVGERSSTLLEQTSGSTNLGAWFRNTP